MSPGWGADQPFRRARIYWGAALVISLGAVGWTRFELVPSFNTADTLVAGIPHARSPVSPQPALARRVVVLVLDGLGYDAALGVPDLAPIRDRGALRRLDAELPTFTSPAITSMVTGLGPRDSGVRLNGDETGAVGLDSVLRSAWDEGVYVRVRARGFAPFSRLVRPPAQADLLAGRWAFAADLVMMDVLPPPSADGRRSTELTWVHLGEVDDAGHRCGSACDDYEAAVAHAAATVTATASRLDPDRDLLIVASDHGTLASGGHGGDEPELAQAFLLAWGARVRHGQLDPRSMRDLAPTLSVAMGVHTPSSNLGEPMLDLWELDEAEASLRLAEPFDQATVFACRLRASPACGDVDGMRARLESGRGASDARDLHGSITRDREEAIARAEQGARRRRTAITFALVAACLVAASRWLGRHAWPQSRCGFLAPVPASFAYGVVLFLFGYRPTLSAMAGEAVFVPHALVASVAAILAMVFAARRSGWSEREAGFAMLAASGAFAVLAAVAGADPKRVPPPLGGVLALQLAPLVAAVAIGGAAVVSLRRGTETRSRRSSARKPQSAGRSGSGCSDEDGCSRTRTGSPPA